MSDPIEQLVQLELILRDHGLKTEFASYPGEYGIEVYEKGRFRIRLWGATVEALIRDVEGFINAQGWLPARTEGSIGFYTDKDGIVRMKRGGE